MPWEIRIVNDEGDMPLGTKQVVVDWVAKALPGVHLQQPPLPPPEDPATFPEAVREAFARPKLEAVYEEEAFSIEFYCGDEPEIRCLHADVRGNGNPLPILARLCLPRGWAVVSAADLSKVDLSSGEANQWKGFCDWRDRAISEIQEGDQV
jgi:hypothetical protein